MPQVKNLEIDCPFSEWPELEPVDSVKCSDLPVVVVEKYNVKPGQKMPMTGIAVV